MIDSCRSKANWDDDPLRLLLLRAERNDCAGECEARRKLTGLSPADLGFIAEGVRVTQVKVGNDR